jgi:N-acetylmuramoyl-L-alanine amidase
MKVVISSGHAKYVQGAVGILNEVDEARSVVEQIAKDLKTKGVGVVTFHDDVSKTQSENLDRIVDFHNTQTRDLDVSVHFNAYEDTDKAMGTECLYLTQDELAERVADSISEVSDLINRGPKKRTDLAFLNGTEAPAILIEVCFVDSSTDARLYQAYFDDICEAVADTIAGGALTS